MHSPQFRQHLQLAGVPPPFSDDHDQPVAARNNRPMIPLRSVQSSSYAIGPNTGTTPFSWLSPQPFPFFPASTSPHISTSPPAQPNEDGIDQSRKRSLCPDPDEVSPNMLFRGVELLSNPQPTGRRRQFLAKSKESCLSRLSPAQEALQWIRKAKQRWGV